MKVYLSNYRNHWLSPYTIMEKVVFWREIDYDEPVIKRWNKILEPICYGWQKVLDTVHPQIKYVKIDRYDTWSMDATLSPIILAMLKQLKKDKHGAPYTNDKDVPPGLRSTNAKPKENEHDTDQFHFMRWDWMLDEMIWTFEQHTGDWENQFHTGESDILWEVSSTDADGKPLLWEMKKGPNDTRKFDKKGYLKYANRIKNGHRLFGTYYGNLWD